MRAEGVWAGMPVRSTADGYEVVTSTPEQMADMIKAELARWAPIVKASGARVD